MGISVHLGGGGGGVGEPFSGDSFVTEHQESIANHVTAIFVTFFREIKDQFFTI